ncbi:MAG: hypothetical protein AAF368_03805, partial [Planctomycetota bacterium]
MLKLKRQVFNGRAPETIPDVLPAELHAEVEKFARTADRLANLLELTEHEILKTSRQRLRDLLDEDQFRVAVRAASPDLASDLGRLRSEEDLRFTNVESALYNYAARYFGKANPFHLFASVDVGGSSNPDTPSGSIQVSLEAGSLLALEQELIVALQDPAREGDPDRDGIPVQDQGLVRLALPPKARHGDGFLFWVATPGGLQIRTHPSQDGLEHVFEFFSQRAARHVPTSRESEWSDFVRALPRDQGQAANAAKKALEQAGILTRFLLTDLSDLSALVTLARRSPLVDIRELAETASALHLRRFDTPSALEAQEPKLQALEKKGRIRHFVSSYHEEPGGPWPRAASLLAADLESVKPAFLAAGHNLSLNSQVIGSYFRDYLSERGGRAPYLEVLTHFLGHRAKILKQYQPEPRGTRSISGERKRRWREQLQALEGTLPAASLAPLLGQSPAPLENVTTVNTLCFNGPYDPASGRYTVTNAFAGEGQFVSRYHLDRSPNLADQDDFAGSSELLDVEIAVPPVPNLNYVVPAYATGTGLESRYSHRYKRWIGPEDLELALVPDDSGFKRVVYRQVSTGRPLRLRYRGFML